MARTGEQLELRETGMGLDGEMVLFQLPTWGSIEGPLHLSIYKFKGGSSGSQSGFVYRSDNDPQRPDSRLYDKVLHIPPDTKLGQPEEKDGHLSQTFIADPEIGELWKYQLTGISLREAEEIADSRLGLKFHKFRDQLFTIPVYKRTVDEQGNIVV